MAELKIKFQTMIFFMAFIFKNLNAQSNVDCSSYKGLWYSKKYPYTDELSKLSLPKAGNNLCPKSTCCDNFMQDEMVGVSQLKLKAITESHLKSIINFLTNNSEALNDYFQTNLDQSRTEMHNMFTHTYSTNYNTNQQFFFEFYDKLKFYMSGKDQNIEKILETFFHDMAEKILSMMILTKKDPDTIRCLTNNFLKLDPYQSVDKKIISSFKMAYPSARMLVNSLKAARDVFIELSQNKITPSIECAQVFARAFECPSCAAVSVLPCEGLCKSIVENCFGSMNSKEITKLSRSWKKLLAVIDKLSKKMKHPYNYFEVNNNLHVKISSAIMNVHNFFPGVQKKIWETCNQQIRRMRRSANNGFNQYFENPSKPLEIAAKSMDLSKIVDRLSEKVPEMSLHLQKHKNTICSNLNLPKPGSQCWNGKETTTSYLAKPKDKSYMKNLKIDPKIQESVNRLNEISQTLNNIINDKIKDPDAFKIKHVEKPKIKPNINPKQTRITEQSIEGSGNNELENSILKNKPALPPVEKIKPAEVVEGSGVKKPPVNENKNNRPAFPEIPTTPKDTIKKPAIPDDEDLAPESNTDDKNKIKKPFNRNKQPIEGSGSVDSADRFQETTKIITTTTTPQPTTTRMRLPIKEERPVKEPRVIEGSGQVPDEESNPMRPDDLPPRNSVVQYPMISSQPPIKEESTSVSIPVPDLLENDLPGVVPEEIWIPRLVKVDKHGQIITENKNAASPRLVLAQHALCLSVLVGSIVHLLVVVAM